MITLWNKFTTALRNWPWVGKPVVRTKEELMAEGAAVFDRIAGQVDRINEAHRRNEKLASLARWIDGATRVAVKLKGQKKRYSHILDAIKVAQTDRLMIETGRMVYDPAFGAWVVKGEK